MESEENVLEAMQALHREHGTSKKKRADTETWDRNVNKKKRQSGEEYVGRKYESENKFVLETKPAKSLGNPCGCKTSYTECSKLTEEGRQEIFQFGNWTGRRRSNLCVQRHLKKMSQKERPMMEGLQDDRTPLFTH